jgi:hypothetical protein
MAPDQKKNLIEEAMKKSGGILRLAPCWVARNFMIPGRRLKLDTRDLYAMGAEKGGIDERWFSSTTPADNGTYTTENEGLSFIVLENGNQTEQVLLKDAIDLMGDRIIGTYQMEKYGRWMMFSKFFDNMGPIAHHVHLMDEHAKNVGALGKPEAYYFPRQQNYVDDNFPHTFFGLEPGTTKEDIKKCLEVWGDKGDNGILDYTKAYRLKPGTGWDVPAGILHAPGSLCTYEPQRASDVSVFFQPLVEGRYNTRFNLEKDIPKDKHYDYDYLVSILNWELNVDPEFKKHRYHEPIPVKNPEEMREQGYEESWIVYGRSEFCAKELTVLPGRTVTITDSAAYGLIMLDGYGTMNNMRVETPAMIRFGQLTNDEMFVTDEAAKAGVKITNMSDCHNIVMLKHFGPDNQDVAAVTPI